MAERAVRLPDVGEGVAEAELVEWLVKVGDHVREDQSLVIVMTDKASVEVPSPVAGEVLWLAAEPGESIAVGSDLVRLKVEGEGAGDGEAAAAAAAGERAGAAQRGRDAAAQAQAKAPRQAQAQTQTKAQAQAQAQAQDAMRAADAGARATVGEAGAQPATPGATAERAAGAPGARLRPGASPVLPRARGEKPIASPAVRARAREAGVDLRRVAGSGPAGRITHEDLDRLFEQGTQAPAAAGAMPAPDQSVEDIKIVGLRRRIAEKMRVAHERIADMTYVEELDATDLESLRAKLNESQRDDRPRLTLLPFLMRAIAIAVAEQPRMNAHFDDDNGVLRRYGGVHIGIAAQTAGGLVVPVVRHVEARDLWSCAAELARVTDAAKGGTATREELAGSTITITSLGALGGIVTTPVINHPEVAIVGVNRIAIRPSWNGTAFVPRKMMNLSCSFDHRVVDGWDAAVFVHRIKALLETPAMLFVS